MAKKQKQKQKQSQRQTVNINLGTTRPRRKYVRKAKGKPPPRVPPIPAYNPTPIINYPPSVIYQNAPASSSIIPRPLTSATPAPALEPTPAPAVDIRLPAPVVDIPLRFAEPPAEFVDRTREIRGLVIPPPAPALPLVVGYPERPVAELLGIDPLVPLPVDDEFVDAEGELVPQQFPAVKPARQGGEQELVNPPAPVGARQLLEEEPPPPEVFDQPRPPATLAEQEEILTEPRTEPRVKSKQRRRATVQVEPLAQSMYSESEVEAKRSPQTIYLTSESELEFQPSIRAGIKIEPQNVVLPKAERERLAQERRQQVAERKAFGSEDVNALLFPQGGASSLTFVTPPRRQRGLLTPEQENIAFSAEDVNVVNVNTPQRIAEPFVFQSGRVSGLRLSGEPSMRTKKGRTLVDLRTMAELAKLKFQGGEAEAQPILLPPGFGSIQGQSAMADLLKRKENPLERQRPQAETDVSEYEWGSS